MSVNSLSKPWLLLHDRIVEAMRQLRVTVPC